MRKLIALFIIISFLSCKKNKGVPPGIIEPAKMQLVFWDYIRADVFTRDFVKKDSSVNDTIADMQLQNRIFNYYKISRNDFYRSYDYYVNHPELMNPMMDSMIAKQEKRRAQIRKNKQ